MKRKVLVVSLSALTCLTLSSCDILGSLGGLQENNLTVKEARDLTQEVLDNTRAHLTNLANGDSYYLDFDTSLKGSYNVSVETSSTYDNEKSTSSASGNINGQANASIALDLYKIKEGSLEGSRGNAYGELSYTEKENDSIAENVDSGHYEGNFSIDDQKVNVYVNDNDYETNEEYEVNDYVTELSTSIAEGVINFPDDLVFSFGMDSQNISYSYDLSFLDTLNDQTNKFKDKEITSKQYLDSVCDIFEIDLEKELETEDYNLIIKVLDKHESILPEYFFKYNKEESNGYTLLKAEFDYASWLVSFGIAVADILKEETVDFEEVMDMVDRITTSYLPTKLEMSYVLKIDNRGCFAGYTFDLNVEGLATETMEWTNNSGTYVDTTKVKYSGSASVAVNFRASDTPKANLN